MASALMFEYLRVGVAAHLMSLAAMLAVFERDHFQLSLSTYAISNQLELYKARSQVFFSFGETLLISGIK